MLEPDQPMPREACPTGPPPPDGAATVCVIGPVRAVPVHLDIRGPAVPYVVLNPAPELAGTRGGAVGVVPIRWRSRVGRQLLVRVIDSRRVVRACCGGPCRRGDRILSGRDPATHIAAEVGIQERLDRRHQAIVGRLLMVSVEGPLVASGAGRVRNGMRWTLSDGRARGRRKRTCAAGRRPDEPSEVGRLGRGVRRRRPRAGPARISQPAP